jgi:cell division septation protein DedD
MRIAAPLPKVLEPAIEGLGDRIPMPDPADAEADDDSGPARPVNTTQSVWVVQVGAFADDARASVLVGQLAARGFTAFKSTRSMRTGMPLRVVLVGPFGARPAAAAALDKIEDMPGVGEPILQLVPPAVR